jgi:hypothetical protein
MAKLVRRYRKNKKRQERSNPAPRRNPPLVAEVLEFVGPGFAAFAATRFATQIASTQIAKRWPSMATHAGAAASVGSFLAAWFLGNKVKLVEKYQSAIIAGSGIAALQSIIQLYFPKLGWIVSDATPQIADTTATSAPAPSPTDQTQQTATSDFEILDDGVTSSWRGFNDAGDPGRYADAPAKRPAARSQQATQQSEDSDVFDMLETDDINDLQAAGIFQ